MSAIFGIEISVEQRIIIKFCQINEFSRSEELKMLQDCYGDECLSKTQNVKSYKSFGEVRVVSKTNLAQEGHRPQILIT